MGMSDIRRDMSCVGACWSEVLIDLFFFSRSLSLQFLEVLYLLVFYNDTRSRIYDLFKRVLILDHYIASHHPISNKQTIPLNPIAFSKPTTTPSSSIVIYLSVTSTPIPSPTIIEKHIEPPTPPQQCPSKNATTWASPSTPSSSSCSSCSAPPCSSSVAPGFRGLRVSGRATIRSKRGQSSRTSTCGRCVLGRYRGLRRRVVDGRVRGFMGGVRREEGEIVIPYCGWLWMGAYERQGDSFDVFGGLMGWLRVGWCCRLFADCGNMLMRMKYI